MTEAEQNFLDGYLNGVRTFNEMVNNDRKIAQEILESRLPEYELDFYKFGDLIDYARGWYGSRLVAFGRG